MNFKKGDRVILPVVDKKGFEKRCLEWTGYFKALDISTSGKVLEIKQIQGEAINLGGGYWFKSSWFFPANVKKLKLKDFLKD